MGSSLSMGDPIRITVEVGQDSRIYCYYEDTAGNVTRLFPNRYQKNSVEKSRSFLDSVAEMLLKEEYATRTLIVEGHTDAVGTESGNQRLSERRALAVKEYLVTRYGIDPFRLLPTGKGESELFKPEAP